ncbi:hypothetical protein BDN70DRAFT_475654 [Pholiota conissans]|uniref:Uncharacterized protein n=1 Tax=Pholiota conissans TaxID=109636 RepID=A0A9P5YRB6_9AGAR|nr:hypothetical protein BDN70DRAFT_475654 [Pholiota conissans]
MRVWCLMTRRSATRDAHLEMLPIVGLWCCYLAFTSSTSLLPSYAPTAPVFPELYPLFPMTTVSLFRYIEHRAQTIATAHPSRIYTLSIPSPYSGRVVSTRPRHDTTTLSSVCHSLVVCTSVTPTQSLFRFVV